MSIYEIILNFLPPFIIIFVGYSICLFILKNFSEKNIFEKWILTLIIGTSIFMFSVIVLLPINRYLQIFYRSLTILLVTFGVLSIFLKKSHVIKDLSNVIHHLKISFTGSSLQVFATLLYIFFIIKVVFALSIKPINDPDSLMLYLPIGREFVEHDGFGRFERVNAGVSLLYAWSWILLGSFSAEPFRLLPSIYIISYPILIYLIAKDFFSARVALLTIILSCFSPIIDSSLHSWSFHPDVLAVVLGVCGIFFFLKQDILENNMITGLGIASSLLLKNSVGIAIVISMVFIYLLKNKIYIRMIVISSLLISIIILGWFKFAFSLQLIISLVVIVLLINFLLTNYKIEEINLDKMRLFQTFFFFTPLLIWELWRMLKGAFFLGIPFLSNPFYDRPSFSIWFSMSREDMFLSNPLVQNIFFLMYHPIADLSSNLFKIIGVIACFFNRRGRKIALLFFLHYLLFFSIEASSPQGRHLLLTTVYLIPIIGFGIDKLILNLFGNKHIYLILTILSMVIGFFNLMQQSTFYYWTNVVLEQRQIGNIIKQIISPAVRNYLIPCEVENLFTFSVIVLVTIIMLILFFKYIIENFEKPIAFT